MLFPAYASIVFLRDFEQFVAAIGGKELASFAQGVHVGWRHGLKTTGDGEVLL